MTTQEASPIHAFALAHHIVNFENLTKVNENAYVQTSNKFLTSREVKIWDDAVENTIQKLVDSQTHVTPVEESKDYGLALRATATRTFWERIGSLLRRNLYLGDKRNYRIKIDESDSLNLYVKSDSKSQIQIPIGYFDGDPTKASQTVRSLVTLATESIEPYGRLVCLSVFHLDSMGVQPSKYLAESMSSLAFMKFACDLKEFELGKFE